MEQVYTKSIRNVALLGHSGGGKTSLAEAMAYLGGITSRIGKNVDSAVKEYMDEEEKKQ